MAFKDVGARFMSRCLGYFNKDKKDSKYGSRCYIWRYRWRRRIPGAKGVEVIILYPSGKVSDIQERQLTTGTNIRALSRRCFDDCQDMVKAFLDESLKHHNLTSANSINIALVATDVLFLFFIKH
jgi:threonine synthase